MNLPLLQLKAKAKGVLNDISDLPYTPLLENGDSSPFFGNYVGQRYGSYDISTCWDYSGVECMETRLEMLHTLGLMPEGHWQWLKDNGYIDEDGDVYLSRPWAAILSGVRDNGNYQQNFWELVSIAGVIPNSMLPHDSVKASDYSNREDFIDAYFDPKRITLEMENLGKEFLKRFKIKAKTTNGGYLKDIGIDLLSYLKEGSLQIGVPVPQDGSWNQQYVKFPNRFVADHAIEMWKIILNIDFPAGSYDSYEPHIKWLSKDYWISFVTRFQITCLPYKEPVQLPQFSPWMKFWFNLRALLQGKVSPFPDVSVG